MNKFLWLKALCLVTLFCFSVHAAEGTACEQEHAVLGDRQASKESCYDEQKNMSVSVQKEDDGLLIEKKANFVPSEEMLAASKQCLEEKEGEKACNERGGGCDLLKAKPLYVTTHPNALHYPIAVTLPYGDPVQLEDGSIWSIYTGDSYKTLNWLTTDNILIFPNRNVVWKSIYPFRLLNQQTGVSVQATYAAAPWVGGGYARWIYSIDYYNCQLVLNDGSIWNIPFCDAPILDLFFPGDYVIIGFNDFPGNGLGANILINFNIMEYVYSNCIFY